MKSVGINQAHSRKKPKGKFSVALISLYGIENLGIRYLSANLKKHGYEVHVIFFKKWVNDDLKTPREKETELLLALLKRLSPDVVGIGFGSNYYELAQKLTMNIRVLSVPVVWGGIHPTVNPEQCIKNTDLVCVGEGEDAMLELAAALKMKKDVSVIRNLWCRTSSGIVRNPVRPLIRDLDTITFPDYDKHNKYFIEDNLLREEDPLLSSAEIRVMASRGCPHSCSYCYNSTLKRIYAGKGDYHRIRSVGSVILELKSVKARFKKLRLIKFDDDTFVFTSDWIKEFCRRYKTDIKVPFSIMLTPKSINPDFLGKLKEAGLVRVHIGVQSCSKSEIENVYEREFANEEVRVFSRLNKKLGLEVTYDVILDNPLGTIEDKEKVIDFFVELERPFRLFIYSLTVFPGTRLAEILRDRGGLEEEKSEGGEDINRYRSNFYYPALLSAVLKNRSSYDVFLVGLLSLTSKDFIPRRFIRILRRSSFLKKHPLPLMIFAVCCNIIKALGMASRMLVRGELTMLRIKEYGSLKKVINQ